MSDLSLVGLYVATEPGRGMRGISVLVAGAGLAGLTAARELTKKGAAVTVIDARDRVGGRVFTFREPFLHGEHAEAGADLIDESQTEICTLIAAVGLRTAKILPGGFTSVRQDGARRRIGGKRGWEDLAQAAAARSARVLRQRAAMGWRRRRIARASNRSPQWLDRIRAPKALRDVAVGLRGFFLADPERAVAAGARPISSPRRALPAARRCSVSSAATIASRPCSQKRSDPGFACRRSFVASHRRATASRRRSNRTGASTRRASTISSARCRPRRSATSCSSRLSPKLSVRRRHDPQVRRGDENRTAVRPRAVANARQASGVRHAAADWRRVGWKREMQHKDSDSDAARGRRRQRRHT